MAGLKTGHARKIRTSNGFCNTDSSAVNLAPKYSKRRTADGVTVIAGAWRLYSLHLPPDVALKY